MVLIDKNGCIGDSTLLYAFAFWWSTDIGSNLIFRHHKFAINIR